MHTAHGKHTSCCECPVLTDRMSRVNEGFALADEDIQMSRVPMGPGWSAARRQEVALGSRPLSKVLPDQTRQAQVLQHPPPNTLSSAWAQLAEKQHQESMPAGPLDPSMAAVGASLAAIGAAKGPVSISMKSGYPVKAKVPALMVSYSISLHMLTLLECLGVNDVRQQRCPLLHRRIERLHTV